MLKNVKPSLFSALAITSVAGPAWAQSPRDADQGDGVEEIVVTAQRRSESLSDVPQSLAVLRGETLANEGVQSLQDIASRVPGISVNGGSAGRQQITLRGITTGQDVSPTVGVYIDDVPYGAVTVTSGAAQLALELGTFDVEQIEVLRGPQGTLYGASAFGGVLKYILKQPSPTNLEGKVQVEGSSSEGGGFNYGVRAAASIPLSEDKLAVRATVVRNHNDGLIDNVVTGKKNVDTSDSTVGRLSLLFNPTSELKLRATILSQEIDRDGNSQVDYDGNTGRPAFGNLTQSRLLPESFGQQLHLYTAGGDYDFGFATLTATAGHQAIDTQFDVDASFLVAPFGPLLESLGVPVDAIGNPGSYTTDKTTVEARLASPSNHTFEWLAGLYYTKEKSLNSQRLIGYQGGVPSDFDIGTFILPASFEEEAIYADGTYYLTPNLDATLGVRFSHNEQTFEQIGSGLISFSNPGSSSSDNVATYLGTLRYRLSERAMIYARAASGYRPGGADLITTDPDTGLPSGDGSYQPDTLWNYELGTKLQPATWVTLDASWFYIDWKDIQLFRTVNSLTVLSNGGAAVSKGAEFAATFRPIRGWSVTTATTYTNARLADAAPELGGNAGDRVPNVASWTSSLATDYEFDYSDSVTASVGAHWRYVGARKTNFDPAQYRLPSYQALDLRTGVGTGTWRFDLYANNVFDRRGQASASTATGLQVSMIQPRTFGLLVSKEF